MKAARRKPSDSVVSRSQKRTRSGEPTMGELKDQALLDLSSFPSAPDLDIRVHRRAEDSDDVLPKDIDDWFRQIFQKIRRHAGGGRSHSMVLSLGAYFDQGDEIEHVAVSVEVYDRDRKSVGSFPLVKTGKNLVETLGSLQSGIESVIGD